MRSCRLLLAGLLFAATPALAQVGQFPFALTQQGQMLGGVEADIAFFKGLAFAAPPVGALRWHPPQPAADEADLRTAYEYGSPCLQPAATRSSEDCLTLNVFRPFGVDGPLPIMVFIHGGDFVRGTANEVARDGARLARSGIVVITLNYRLGVLGWLAPARGSGDTGPVNLGLMDQIAALQWIHDNAAAFGGDPDNVTLFGDGAGATSIALLMLCDRAHGLFHKAILQSLPARAPVLTADAARAAARQVAEALGGDLDTADPRRLVKAQDALLAARPRSIGPVLDDDLVRSDIASGFRAGRQAHIPLIIGSNEDETGADGVDASEPARMAADDLRRLYADLSADPETAAARLATDRHFSEPARLLARLHAASGGRVFRYRFGYVPDAERMLRDGGHGRELRFVFGIEGVPGAGILTRRDREVAQTLRAYWTNFATSGDPNGADLPRWEPAAPGDRLLRITATAITSGADDAAGRLDYWESRAGE